MDKYKLSSEDKQAVLTAIGVLSWTGLAQSRLRNKKIKLVNSNKT